MAEVCRRVGWRSSCRRAGLVAISPFRHVGVIFNGHRKFMPFVVFHWSGACARSTSSIPRQQRGI